MIWLTWRQFRTQTWVALAALIAVAGGLAAGANTIADLYADSGIAGCTETSGCGELINSFLRRAREGAAGFAYFGGLFLMYAVPLLIGIFWGAPLVAREFETGTFRLVWNQSVTRYRWLAVKLVTIGGASAVLTGLCSALVSWAATRVDQAAFDRITPLLFAARGIVPIGYAVFAFALGVTAGTLIRRAVPAMAATLAVYTAAVVAMPVWVRAQLLPAEHVTTALDTDKLEEFLMNQAGEMTIIGKANQPGAWIIDNSTITPSGRLFTGPSSPTHCGRDTPQGSCEEWIGTLNLRQSVTFHPASQFWALQWVETGIFVGLALLLVGFTFWWLRRRAT